MKESKGKAIIDKAIAELASDIEAGGSERYLKYLEWKAMFHEYSWSNTIMMMTQREDCTFVRGYKQWEHMGYHINKGEKGMVILAPMSCSYIYRLPDKINKIFWSKMTAAERKDTKKHLRLTYFVDVYVFDIKQTDCTEHPTFFHALGETDLYDKVRNIFGDEIRIDEVEGTKSEGSFHYLIDEHINIKKQDTMNMLLTLIHELGHYYLHKIPDYKTKYDYKDGELHAESVSFIVSKYLGLNNPFSKDYIINWKGNAAKLKDNMQIISEVANKIMTAISSKLSVSKAA